MLKSSVMSSDRFIGQYKVTSKLGQGGMGEVWRATDTKLGREVAIKLLPEAFANDPDRLARFQREAQVLASLNHPNIAAIYGVEDGALVMELVEGPTLAERIGKDAVPSDEALEIARQIGEALEAAHEKGIVHRDLKPANIKLTPDGRVKVLDFGLAKAASGETLSGVSVDSPTITMRSGTGIIVGTAAYMAPEQAKGKTVDRRADIWAFGVVLYETLTGTALFAGETVSDSLAAVLTKAPDLERVPLQARRLVRSCLEKDPKRRLRDIGDAWSLLDETPASMCRPPQSVVPWALAAVFAFATAGLALVHFREAPQRAEPVRFTVLPPDKGAFGNWLALSPDGRHLAYPVTATDGVRRIWLRSLDSPDARLLAGTEGASISSLFWSPDSRFVVFQANGKIRKLDIAGGASQTICEDPAVMLGGSWNADGVILFGNNTGPVLRVPSSGGVPSPVTRVEMETRSETFHTDPIFLSDDRHFLYFRHSSRPDNEGVFVGALDIKPEQQSSRRITAVDFSEGYAPPRNGGSIGNLLFVRNGSIVAQPFDERRLETAGEATRVTEQVGTALSRGFFSVSATGVLAYRVGSGTSGGQQLVWYDRRGHVLGRAGESGDYQDVALSPDDSRVAYTWLPPSGDQQIWILDLSRLNQSPFTFLPGGARAPVWSRDSRYLSFSSAVGRGMYVKDVNQGGDAVTVLQSATTYSSSWSSDNRFLLFTLQSSRIAVMALPDPLGNGEHKPIRVVNSEFAARQGQVSPDSHWIAYSSDESGRPEIYVRPFPPGDGRTGKWPVSSNYGGQPRWRADGKELYYLDSTRTLMAVDVNPGPSFQYGTPHALFTLPPSAGRTPLFQYDVARAADRFISIAPLTGATSDPITVVLNWERQRK